MPHSVVGTRRVPALREPRAGHVAHRADRRRGEHQQVAEEARLVRPPDVRQRMTTAVPATAIAHPTTHVADTRRRSTMVPKRLVSTGSIAKISVPCTAEVMSWPKAKTSGKPMYAANPEKARRRRSCAAFGQLLAQRQGERQRQAAAEHGPQDADEQRVDLAGGDLREHRRAAPHDHDDQRHREGQRELVVPALRRVVSRAASSLLRRRRRTQPAMPLPP